MKIAILKKQKATKEVQELITEYLCSLYGKCRVDIESFVGGYEYLYICLDDKDYPVGFVTVIKHDDGGRDTEKLYIDNMYVRDKKYKAFALLMYQVGLLVQYYKLPLQFVTSNDELKEMSDKFNAKKVYNVVEYSYEDSIVQLERFEKLLYKG